MRPGLEGLGDVLEIQARPSEMKTRSLELAPLSWDTFRGVWDHAKGVITEEVALELGFEGWGLFQPQRWRKDTEGTVSAKHKVKAQESETEGHSHHSLPSGGVSHSLSFPPPSQGW